MLRIYGSLVCISLLLSSCEKEPVQDPCLPKLSISKKTSRLQDEQTLMLLYQGLLDLSGSVTCNDASDWKFVAVGSKACGGPTGFLPYSSTLNEECWLKNVNHYTEQMKKFNLKYNIFSDCSVLPQPKGVVCQNGKPVFTF